MTWIAPFPVLRIEGLHPSSSSNITTVSDRIGSVGCSTSTESPPDIAITTALAQYRARREAARPGVFSLQPCLLASMRSRSDDVPTRG